MLTTVPLIAWSLHQAAAVPVPVGPAARAWSSSAQRRRHRGEGEWVRFSCSCPRGIAPPGAQRCRPVAGSFARNEREQAAG